ncbi:hypothetical protein AURDEDRAFT_173906 [Auricularia subglabra TFB-10046 SS5]|nr:hypothetical protein AURDEDRAFT_173906 [Auricularia subglabra TFB-10046 SS5]
MAAQSPAAIRDSVWVPAFPSPHSSGWLDRDGASISDPRVNTQIEGGSLDPRVLTAPSTANAYAPRHTPPAPLPVHFRALAPLPDHLRTLDSNALTAPSTAGTPHQSPSTPPSVELLDELIGVLALGGASRNTDPGATPPVHILDLIGGTHHRRAVRFPTPESNTLDPRALNCSSHSAGFAAGDSPLSTMAHQLRFGLNQRRAQTRRTLSHPFLRLSFPLRGPEVDLRILPLQRRRANAQSIRLRTPSQLPLPLDADMPHGAACRHRPRARARLSARSVQQLGVLSRSISVKPRVPRLHVQLVRICWVKLCLKRCITSSRSMSESLAASLRRNGGAHMSTLKPIW